MSDDQKTWTLVDTARASNPGDLKVNRWVWFRNYPRWPIIWLASAGVCAALAYLIHQCFLTLGALLLVMNWLYWRRVGEHFRYGCTCPAMIVSSDPMLIAVSTDLTKGLGQYPVIKIIEKPLRTACGQLPQVGRELPAIALYSLSGDELPHWRDFDPRPIDCASGDLEAIQRVMSTIAEVEWNELRTWLEQLPRPFRCGLYHVKPLIEAPGENSTMTKNEKSDVDVFGVESEFGDSSIINGDQARSFRWEVLASGDEGPGKRSRHGFAYDRDAAATVLVGGIIWDDGGTLQSDTWELHGGGWHFVDRSPTPAARHRGAMVYDTRRGCCVLFGGQGSRDEMLSDTWFYGGQRWRRWRGSWFASRPRPRCGHSLAFNEEEGVAVLFGGIAKGDRSLGDSWLFDGTRWRRVRGPAPPARRYAAFAYDPVFEGCVLHGGSEDDHGRKQFGDTWLFRDGAWTRLSDSFDTDARDDHALAYHHAASALVMLGGLGGARGLLVRDSNGWRPAPVTPLHPRHQCAPLAWDASLNGLVLHGGEACHGGSQMDATLVLRLQERRLDKSPHAETALDDCHRLSTWTAGLTEAEATRKVP